MVDLCAKFGTDRTAPNKLVKHILFYISLFLESDVPKAEGGVVLLLRDRFEPF